MNVYDVLRKLVEARGFTATEQSDALKLITDLEKIGALGTTASQLDERDHDCDRAGPWFPQSMQCHICGKSMDPPSHACIPAEKTPVMTGWGRARTEIRCMICNKEMG